MYCRTCGKSNPDWANYCIYDGTALHTNYNSEKLMDLKETNYCPGCGEKVSEKANYCIQCGSSLVTYSVSGRKVNIELTDQKPEIPPVSGNLSFEYYKQRFKLTLVPAILSFALMFVFSSFLYFSADSTYDQIFKDMFGVTPQDFYEQYSEHYDTYVEPPKNAVQITDFAMISHFVPTVFILNYEEPAYEVRINADLEISASNVLYAVFPLAALFIGGFYYRRKTGEISVRSFLAGALGIGLIYSILLLVLSFFSGVNLTLDGQQEIFSFHAKYSFFLALINGLVFGICGSLLGMLFSIDRRRITKHLETLIPFGSPVHHGIAAFIRGFVILSVIVIIYIGQKVKGLKELFEYIDLSFLSAILEKSTSMIIFSGVQFSSWIYSMIHFSPFTFELRENADGGRIEYSAFSGLSLYGDAKDLDLLQYFISASDTGLYLKLATIIPAAFLVYAGYKLAVSGQANFITLAVFSLAYSVLTALFSRMGTMTIDFSMLITDETPERISLLLGTSTVKAFIGSFVAAYILGYAGSLIPKFVHKQ